MSIDKARNILLCVFLSSFSMALLLVVIPFLRGEIYYDSLFILFRKVTISLYFPHFAVILGCYFGAKEPKKTTLNSNNFRIALIFSLMWNILLLLGFIIFQFTNEMKVDDLNNYIDDYVRNSSFLVTAILAYFFTKGD